MIKEIIATGKDIIEAKDNARAALGAGPLDDVNFEILHAGSKGIFGIIGVKPAQVRAYIELPDTKPKHKKPDDRKKDRPTEDKSAKQSSERSDKPRKKKHDKPRRDSAPAGEQVKSEVIPEVELKMEKREVAQGEDMSYDFVKSVISDIGLSAEAELYACEDGTRRITIVGEDASALIGHHGDTLDALQYLANLASAKKNVNGERDKSRVTIDIEGYRAKREATLRALARRMAAKALRNKRSIMLEPMSAYERRIIHSEIQGIEGLSTNSVGSDSNRKIVIYLTDKKPQGIFEEKEEDSADVSLKDDFHAEEEHINAPAIDAVTLSDLASDGEAESIEHSHSEEDIAAHDSEADAN